MTCPQFPRDEGETWTTFYPQKATLVPPSPPAVYHITNQIIFTLQETRHPPASKLLIEHAG